MTLPIAPQRLMGFALVALTLVCTPGPNMMYLLSRTVAQGRRAGLVSLGGVALGFVVYVASAALGLTSLLVAVPVAFDALRAAGVLYLAWLAVSALRADGRSVLRRYPVDSDRRLFTMGFLTNLFNPKAAILYLSLLPQFVDPGRGPVLPQFLLLGGTQIAVSVGMNALFVTGAGRVAAWLERRPSAVRLQRWLLATVFGALAVRLALQRRPAAG